MRRATWVIIAVLAVAIAGASAANATILTFNSLGHGEITNNQFVGAYGITISAHNLAGGPHIAFAFDSEVTGTTADPDLQRNPPGGRDNWAGGNLPSSTNLGKVIAITESGSVDGDGDGFIDNPNDEGGRPAGILSFDFMSDITHIGFDAVDFEEWQTSSVSAYKNGALLGTINFSDFVARDGAVFGDAKINRIAPLLATDFNAAATGIDSVSFYFGGSGAVDNLSFGASVPEPATLLLLGGGLAGAFGLQRKRRKA